MSSSAIAVEAIKFLIQMYFNNQRLQGKTEIEIKKLFLEELETFTSNPATKLEDV